MGAGTWGGLRGPARWNETFRVTFGDTGLGHGVGLGDKWGHGVGLGPAWWNETFRVTLGDTGLGHGVGLGDKWGTWGWDMGWA